MYLSRRLGLRVFMRKRLTLLAAVFLPHGGHHRLEGAVHSLRLRVEPHVRDIGRENDGVGDAAAEIFLPRGYIRALFEYVHKVGLAFVWPLQLECVRERQLDLKIARAFSLSRVYTPPRFATLRQPGTEEPGFKEACGAIKPGARSPPKY